MVRVETGAFGSVVGALPIELLGNISTDFGIFNQYKVRKYALRTWGENSSQEAFAYIIFFILTGD